VNCTAVNSSHHRYLYNTVCEYILMKLKFRAPLSWEEVGIQTQHHWKAEYVTRWLQEEWNCVEYWSLQQNYMATAVTNLIQWPACSNTVNLPWSSHPNVPIQTEVVFHIYSELTSTTYPYLVFFQLPIHHYWWLLCHLLCDSMSNAETKKINIKWHSAKQA
jgi:hypothetical protein